MGLWRDNSYNCETILQRRQRSRCCRCGCSSSKHHRYGILTGHQYPTGHIGGTIIEHTSLRAACHWSLAAGSLTEMPLEQMHRRETSTGGFPTAVWRPKETTPRIRKLKSRKMLNHLLWQPHAECLYLCYLRSRRNYPEWKLWGLLSELQNPPTDVRAW